MRRLADLVNPNSVAVAKTALIKSVQIQPVTAAAVKAYIIKKFNHANSFYKHLTGLDELDYYHERVHELQNSLMEAQQKRRQLSYLLNEVRGKSIEVQDQLHKVKRHEEPAYFLELMKEETEFIKKERTISASLSEQERHERDVFSAFTNAIRDSQEKQHNRMEYAKYIGFGLTLFGALGSYLITTWRTKDLKTVVRDSIREDVHRAFVESAKDSALALQRMTELQLSSQAQALHALETKLFAELKRIRLQRNVEQTWQSALAEQQQQLLQSEGSRVPHDDVPSMRRFLDSTYGADFVDDRWSVIKLAGAIGAGLLLLSILIAR